MAERVALAIEKRQETGSGAAARLRRSGMIPGVVYGKSIAPINVKVPVKELREIISKHGRNAVLNLNIEGQTLAAVIKDLQHDLMGTQYEHVDFQHILMNEVIKTKVPIRLQGEGLIESKGGLVMLQLDELDVECLPDSLPEVIEIDVSDMEVGQSLKVADINVPENVRIISNPDEIVLAVMETKSGIQEIENEENNEEEQL
ncbi:50S ribosomal protein L25 [Mahella australiensis]|uniref:Large ribosomal subunit protein bL25 n=1 Tax=Mahella australiensis (strain DSM 15567 / CIP 107919 / 50-1 BON) TaxID=697281 RepID=F4A040_MAHA5|nr:50S ribosomal protein L25 [Mahella australiensis]AEE96874.1 ribosomal 5S rRNA E-loop binding protein Ctc/L25/TL5 [Mahella australiensis 50-1 BON]